MIKLEKTYPAPASLASIKCTEALTKIQEKVKKGEKINAKDFGTLYKQDDVKGQLKIDQHNKCVYCETNLLDRQKHVEHYRPKSKYWWLAYDWDNLFSCCCSCNIAKLAQFPLENESTRFNLPKEIPLLINPYKEDPSNYIAFHEEEATAKDGLIGLQKQKADTTIDMLLNREDLKMRRRDAWNTFVILEQSYYLLSHFGIDNGFRREDYLNANHEFSGMFRNQQ